MGVLYLLQTSFTSMCPMLSITSTGAIITYMKFLNKSTNSLLTDQIMYFFGPVFHFTYISSSLDFNDLVTIWPLFAIPLLMNCILIIFSYFLCRLAGYPSTMKNTFTILFAINNFGLVFTLAAGVCSPYGPIYGNENCSDAFSYISIYNFSQTFMYWTVAFTIVGQDKKILISQLEEEIIESPTIKKNTLCTNIYASFKNPNVIACILGLIFAMLPGYKSLFFYSDSPLLPISSIAKEIGFLIVFIGQLVLGSNILMMVGAKSRLSSRLIIFSVFIKTMVIPLISLLVIYSFWIIGIFGENKLMAYVIFMGNSCPPAILSMVFAMILKINVDEVIQNMFWTYIVSIFTLVIWNFLFFLLV